MLQPTHLLPHTFFLIPLSTCSFFFTATATTEIYTLSLHDALPISPRGDRRGLTGPSITPSGVIRVRPRALPGHGSARGRTPSADRSRGDVQAQHIRSPAASASITAERTRTEGPDEMDDHAGLEDLTRRSLQELLKVGHELDLEGEEGAEALTSQLRQVRDEFVQLRMHYQFGIDEVQTKVNILRQEFEQVHDYSPIEHVRTRLKSVESLVEKAVRTGGEMTIPAIRERIHDIAGIRITCSFVSDAYWIADMLSRQPDLTVLKVKDYIDHPKPNGYRSLHLIVEVPVFLSEHTEKVPVELQIRTIAK